MLTEREGTGRAIRSLLRESLLTRLEAQRDTRLFLAEERLDGATDTPAGGHLERHHYPELCVCLAGEAEILLGSGFTRLGAGEVMVIPAGVSHAPGELHCVSLDPKRAYSRLLWIGVFPYGVVANLCETSRGVHSSTRRQLFLDRGVNRHVQELIFELRSRNEGWKRAGRSHLILAITLVCRGMEVTEQEWPAEPPAERPAPDRDTMAGRARRFLHEHFDRQIGLDDVVQAAGSNRSQLCREFRQECGMTVMEYLAKVRIDAAKRLLLTDLKVSAVSKLVGFDDPYHFSRVFRKHTGHPPSDYHELHAGEAMD
jgi:AraC-like DNA-binding protein/uncharacterized protein YjlB